MNNAGLNTRAFVKDTPLRDIYDMVIVNTYTYVALTELLIHKLQSRKKRSAMVMIGSSSHLFPIPFDAYYSATKKYESEYYYAYANSG